jgi:hypothetical protein
VVWASLYDDGVRGGVMRIIANIILLLLSSCARDPALDAIYALPPGIERHYGNHFEVIDE